MRNKNMQEMGIVFYKIQNEKRITEKSAPPHFYLSWTTRLSRESAAVAISEHRFGRWRVAL